MESSLLFEAAEAAELSKAGESSDLAEAVQPREIMPLALRVPPECDGWRLDHFLKQRIRTPRAPAHFSSAVRCASGPRDCSSVLTRT